MNKVEWSLIEDLSPRLGFEPRNPFGNRFRGDRSTGLSHRGTKQIKYLVFYKYFSKKYKWSRNNCFHVLIKK